MTKIITTGKNKIVAVCDNEDDQKKFADVAKKKFSKLCNVETPDRKNRRIKAMNIEIWTKYEEMSAEEIEKRIKEANVSLAQAKYCKVLSFKKAKFNGQESDSRINVFIEVDEVTYELLITRGKITYMYQEIRIVDGFTVGRCFNCLSFDHPKKDCKVEAKTCFNCGEDHLRKDCKENEPVCINCVRANREIKSGKKLDTKHSVSDHDCPCYVRKYNFLVSKIK